MIRMLVTNPKHLPETKALALSMLQLRLNPAGRLFLTFLMDGQSMMQWSSMMDEEEPRPGTVNQLRLGLTHSMLMPSQPLAVQTSPGSLAMAT
jgi:hypothetical protein